MIKRETKRLGGVLLSILLLGGCVTIQGQTAMDALGRGLAGLVLSPLLIVAGLVQGIAFLPYTIGVALNDLNQALIQAQAVTLDDAYRATYGVSIHDPRVDQQTGQVAREGYGFGRYRADATLDATHAFQKLLVAQGMPEDKARHYVITADYTHTRARGVILLSVVYRHSAMEPIRVVAKHTAIVTTFRPDHVGWRQPYERDVNGRLIDEVIDWGAIEYAHLRQDKVVATLMVLAAESVKSGKRSHDYWEVEQRWIAGQTQAIMREASDRMKAALPL